MEKNIDFVVRHYRHGAFCTSRAWHKLGIGQSMVYKRLRVAAVAAILVAAGATTVIMHHYTSTSPAVETPMDTPVEDTKTIVRIIDFDDAPLSAVIEEINHVYGVEVTDMPADAAETRLTLHYEGDVVGLIETINETTGTELRLK